MHQAPPPPPTSGGSSVPIVLGVLAIAAGGLPSQLAGVGNQANARLAGGYYYFATSSDPAAIEARAKAQKAQGELSSAAHDAKDSAKAKADELARSAKSTGRDIQAQADQYSDSAKKEWEKTKSKAGETWEEAKAKVEAGKREAESQMDEATKRAQVRIVPAVRFHEHTDEVSANSLHTIKLAARLKALRPT